MQYFVSIEDCQFFRWQLGLLAQSMSNFGLEDSLVVACAELDQSLSPLCIHGAFYHENFGRKLGYLPLNKPFGLAKAIELGFLRAPFVVLDPDMVMIKPICYSKNVAQYCGYLELQNLISVGYDLRDYEQKWCPGGCVYSFQECDLNEVFKIKELSLDVKNKYENSLSGSIDYWQREMVAFSMLISSMGFSTSNDLACSLDSDSECNFIHYCNGLPPFFNKRVHNNLREFSFDKDLPFDSIRDMPEKNQNISKFKKISDSFAKDMTILF